MGNISGQWTAEVLARLRAQARQELSERPLSSPDATPVDRSKEPIRFGFAFKSAAVRSQFDIKAMEMYATDPEERDRLRASCVPIANTARTLCTLLPEVRNDVLAQMSGTEILGMMRLNPQPDDALQSAMQKAVGGLRVEDLPKLEPAELSALKQFHRGLSAVVPELPARDVIERRLELARLLAPLQQITRNFSGRSDELQQLRDFVGVVPGAGVISAVRRIVRRENRPPMIVCGIGGVGKTTLLARFILEHALIEAKLQFPFAYLDFDRPSVSAEEPLTILDEAVRQIGLEYDEAHASSVKIRERWRPLLQSPATLGPRYQEVFIADFAAFLETLGVREGPVLLVLDTFEEVQMRSAAFAQAVVGLMTTLASLVPRLRVVIAGRVTPPGVFFKTLALTGFDDESAVAYLVSRDIDATSAATIVKHVGTSPLSLNLAIGLFRDRPQDAAALKNAGVFSRVRDGVTQAQLLDRVLLHISDVNVRKLAHPGLILRRITPPLIQFVLADPCGVDVPTSDRAQELFDELAKQVSLVSPLENETGVLVGHPAARKFILDSLGENKPAQVEEIHRLAVRYYASREGIVYRAEEIYHRLSLGESRDSLRKRMMRGIEPYLQTALDELPLAEQAVLAELLGIELPPAAIKAADQETWERSASKRISECLAVGDVQGAGKILAERQERTTATDLRVKEVLYLRAAARWDEATTLAIASVEAYDGDGNLRDLLSMLVLLAALHRERGHLEAATLTLDRALENVPERDVLTRVRILQERTVLAEFAGEPPGDWIDGLISAANTLPDAEWGRDLPLLRAVAATAGHREPALIGRALSLGALELRKSDAQAIIDLLHENVVGLDAPLERSLPRLLERGDVPDALLQELVRLLRETPEPASVTRSRPRRTRRLERQQLDNLRELLVSLYGKRLDSFVERSLRRSLEAITFHTSADRRAADLVDAAVRGGWMENLVLALRSDQPTSPQVLRYCDEIGLGIRRLQRTPARTTLAPLDTSLLIEHQRAALARLESVTCTIETRGQMLGCGFLIQPDVFITEASLVAEAEEPFCRFDRLSWNREPIEEGKTYRFVHHIATDLGLVALRLSDGSETDSRPPSPRYLRREYVPLTRLDIPQDDEELLWLWRDLNGIYAASAVARYAEHLIDGRILMMIALPPEAAGCAVVNRHGKVVAVHLGQDPDNHELAVLMPVGVIFEALKHSGMERFLFDA